MKITAKAKRVPNVCARPENESHSALPRYSRIQLARYLWADAAAERAGSRAGNNTVGILHSRFIDDRVGRRHREPLHDVFVFIHEISRLIQPGSAVEIGHIHHQRVALPAAPRVACPGAIVLQVRTARRAE